VKLLPQALVAGIIGSVVALPAATQAVQSHSQDIRPFVAQIPDSLVTDMRRRLIATRWPDKETVPDASQGVQLATLRELVLYWGTTYNWRKAEAKLNAYPQFITTIDGVDIHFIRVRSRHPNAMPLLIAHGWPGSVFEQLKLIEPLTDPAKYGGRPEDAFDVVIPSLPGFGFSGHPIESGWGVERIGRAFDVLMKRLGYSRYVAQGGDWGAGIVEAMGRQAPAGLLAIHTNLAAALTPDVEMAIGGDTVALAKFPEKERKAIMDFGAYLKNGGLSYLVMMAARPQGIGYALTDSPAGLAGFMLVHGGFAKWSFGKDPQQSPTRDDVLDDFSLYWLTNTATSAARLYWENRAGSLVSATTQKSADIKVPVAVTVFPDEVIRVQESWARRAFPTLSYFHEADRGGHFAMWEHPNVFAAELRAAFKPMRGR